jgi:hypothetical protein
VKRNYNIERALFWHYRYKPQPKLVIPPKSIVRLIKREADWDESLRIGDIFRIGYYRKQDGPHCVWLVDAAGHYSETWDQKSLLDYFEIVTLSNETNTYGTHRPSLGPL